MRLRAARWFWLLAWGVLLLDQGVKQWILEGFRSEGECLSIVLAYNKGVAFSMLEFLDVWLKYLQLGLLAGIALYAHWEIKTLQRYGAMLGILFGAGFSNVLDRFVHGGVVDYVYWHCGFEFAIFNLADVMIDVAIVGILVVAYRNKELTLR